MIFYVSYVYFNGRDKIVVDDNLNSILTRIKLFMQSDRSTICYNITEIVKTEYSSNIEYLDSLSSVLNNYRLTL